MKFSSDAQRKAVMASLGTHGVYSGSMKTTPGPITTKLQSNNKMLKTNVPVPAWNNNDSNIIAKLISEYKLNWKKINQSYGSLFSNSEDDMHLRVSETAKDDAYVASSSEKVTAIPSDLKFFETKEEVAEYLVGFMQSEESIKKDWADATLPDKINMLRFKMGYNADNAEHMATKTFNDLPHKLKIELIEKEMSR